MIMSFQRPCLAFLHEMLHEDEILHTIVYGLCLTLEKITLNLLNLDAVHQGDNLKHFLIKMDFQICLSKS